MPHVASKPKSKPARSAGAANSGGNNPADRFLAEAMKFKGQPYLWGGGHGGAFSKPGPVDCSGLITQAANLAGIKGLGGTAEVQQRMGKPISPVTPENLKPGDFVTMGHPAHHIGIYIGNNQVLEAPHTGDVVKICPLTGYGWDGANRVFDQAGQPVQGQTVSAGSAGGGGSSGGGGASGGGSSGGGGAGPAASNHVGGGGSPSSLSLGGSGGSAAGQAVNAALEEDNKKDEERREQKRVAAGLESPASAGQPMTARVPRADEKKLIDAIKSDPEIQQAFANWDSLSTEQKLAVGQRISELEGKALGFTPVTDLHRDASLAKPGEAGTIGLWKKDAGIGISDAALANPDTFLNTIVHEQGHEMEDQRGVDQSDHKPGDAVYNLGDDVEKAVLGTVVTH